MLPASALKMICRSVGKERGLEELNHGLSEINSLACSQGSAPAVINNWRDEKTKSPREHVIIPNIMASPYRIIECDTEKGNS